MVDERPLEAGAGAESFPTDSGTQGHQARLLGAAGWAGGSPVKPYTVTSVGGLRVRTRSSRAWCARSEALRPAPLGRWPRPISTARRLHPSWGRHAGHLQGRPNLS